MINFDYITKENIKQLNPNWPRISDHPYRLLTTGRSGSGKKNSLFNLISHQPDVRKLYLNDRDPYKLNINC